MPSGIPASAKLVVVGEQPGVSEVRAGQPFVGPSGSVLSDCLAAAKIARGECYVTNVIKDLDYPLSTYYDSKQGEFTPKGASYVEALQEELKMCKADVILAVGNVALKALTSRTGITKWRGSILESTLVPGKWVIPCFHPATVLPPKNVYTNLHLIIYDIKKAARVMRIAGYQVPEYEILIGPKLNQCMSFAEECLKQQHVGFDIEVYNHEVSCISLAYGERAISIPFCNYDGDLFNPDQELDLWLLIAKLLEDPNIVKVGQNSAFDMWFLLTKYGIHSINVEDTMVAQQIISSDFPKGLDFITSIHTDLPYYKDDGKQWFKVGGRWEKLWHYNALDSLVCCLAFPKQMEEIQKMGNMETYCRQRNIIPALVYMMNHGIKVDIEGLAEAGKLMETEADQLELQLAEMAGYPLNPNSPQQLKQYFYVEKKYHAYKNRKTGGLSVDDNALKRLIRKGAKEAKVIQRIRKLRKVSGTYLQLDKLDEDGRIRCSFNPAGTRFSRISSSSNIFGKGMNLQNWPHSVQKFLMVDDYCVGVAIDLGQAENRIVAYYGNVTNMINAFEMGWDLHSLSASSLVDLTWQEIKAEAALHDKDHSLGCSPLGDGTHPWRFWGKKQNHSLNYDLGFRTFALYCELAEKEAKVIVDGYHEKYPGVRNTFHRKIQEQVRAKRCVTNLMGRKTYFLGRIDSNLFKDAYACVPQGTVGDVINERGLSYIYYNPKLFSPIRFLNQVHDEIVFQIPMPNHPENPCSWLEIAQMLTLIKSSLETPLQANGREFVIPADVTLFKRFKCGKDPKFSPDLEEYARNLEETYERLENGEKAQ
jgi:uracil-DNA glycosylase family 4